MTSNANVPSTDLDIVDAELAPRSLIEAFQNSETAVYSTISSDSFEDRLAVVKAMTNAVDLKANLNKPFNLQNWVAQAVDIIDTDGSINPSVRVVLLDDKGNSYACVSSGVAKALNNFQGVLGHPANWPAPVRVKAVEETGRRGFRYLTLVLA